MTELLVVIGIIVLLLVVAMPAFNFITGTRSIDGAQNNLSALLGRARAEAIARQQISGVLFFIDPATDRVAALLVRNASAAGAADIYLDLFPDTDRVLLPQGITLQTLENATIGAGGVRTTHGYIGYGGPGVPFGGALLFDSRGQLVTRTFGFATGGSAIEEILDLPSGTVYDPVPLRASAVGFVLFESQPFQDNNFTREDPMPYTTAEQAEEQWLDANAVPFLLNRYNGTLIRGE